MHVGLVTEVKPGERRCALTPAGTRELVHAGHTVVVQSGAGSGSGFADTQYADAGASVSPEAAAVWAEADLLLKVKEPIDSEYEYLRDGQLLFTYLHLAADRPLTEALVASGTTAIAYETVEDAARRLPLLAPMSEVAGRLAAQAGAYFLQEAQGGPGVLIGGVPGVAPARVTVLGGGVVGTQAARVAVGMGAEVTVLDRSLPRLRELDELFDGRINVLYSTTSEIEEQLSRSDLVIGAVLIPGAAAPKLVSRDMLALMQPRSVLVDVAIDQGGCFESSRPTTHSDPVFVVEGILHYCVANMPGAVPQTSTRALTNATLPYVTRLANLGLERLAHSDPGFRSGISVRDGHVISEPVAASLAA